MRTRIKICCIQSMEEALMAIAGGADAIGLVGAMPSGPGPIPDDRIRALAALAPPPVAVFLLTSEITAEAIAAHVRRVGVHTVQIVSHIDPAQSERLAELVPDIRRVQVVHVQDRGALDLVEAYAPNVHAFLLDSGRPAAGIPELGGTGRVHDWEISRQFVLKSPIPVFLAGGLGAANAAEAIRVVQPYGLDLCSGVRTSGHLDPDKLRAFFHAVRTADAERPFTA